jgi:hypothetical protein
MPPGSALLRIGFGAEQAAEAGYDGPPDLDCIQDRTARSISHLKGMAMKFDGRSRPDGTVLMFGIAYPNSPKVYTYVMVKAGGLWYVTGSGKVPSAAGWGAVEKWLERDDRQVQWIKAATDWADLWPEAVQIVNWPTEADRMSEALAEEPPDTYDVASAEARSGRRGLLDSPPR